MLSKFAAAPFSGNKLFGIIKGRTTTGTIFFAIRFFIPVYISTGGENCDNSKRDFSRGQRWDNC